MWLQVLQVDIGAVHTKWQREHGEANPVSLSTFLDIAMELAAPYRDFREAERKPLTEREVFWALTGESSATLGPGRLLQVRAPAHALSYALRQALMSCYQLSWLLCAVAPATRVHVSQHNDEACGSV